MEEPLLSNPITKSNGGLRTLPSIIANDAFDRVVSFGLASNMVFYLKSQYNMETTTATNLILLWSSATNILPVIGAVVADSYLGRFQMIGFGSITSLLGIILLWLTSFFPPANPTGFQFFLLYAAFVLMSVGSGGIAASSSVFGADQIEKGDTLRTAGLLESYFNWYTVSTMGSYIVSITCIVYIQDNLGWILGFGIPVVLKLLSAILFFLASPYYVKEKPNTNLVIGLAEVVVASFKNRHLELLSSKSADEEIYLQGNGSELQKPSEQLRFLNKACIIRNPQRNLTPDGKASSPWSLCTVDQVEELKALIKVIPIWSAGIMFNVGISQNVIAAVEAKTIDRHITRNFEIPAASISILTIITLIIWIPLYDRVVIPIVSKLRGKPTYLGRKLRMGIGLIFCTAAMTTWAIVENIRRNRAIEEGYGEDPDAVVNMSGLWLVPHNVMLGLGMALYTVAQGEFFYCEFPKSMSSISSSLAGVGLSLSNLVASFILNAVDYLTKIGGKESWVSNNINQGHYDYYFWLLTGLSSVNILYYLFCSKAYGPCKYEVDDDSSKD